MAFCYFVLLPNAIRFLVNFGSEVIQNQLRASEYLSFVTTFILGVGIVFEVPVIIYALVRVHVVDRAWLTKQRRYVFLLVSHARSTTWTRSEEHTSELQSQFHLVCRLLLE